MGTTTQGLGRITASRREQDDRHRRAARQRFSRVRSERELAERRDERFTLRLTNGKMYFWNSRAAQTPAGRRCVRRHWELNHTLQQAAAHSQRTGDSGRFDQLWAEVLEDERRRRAELDFFDAMLTRELDHDRGHRVLTVLARPLRQRAHAARTPRRQRVRLTSRAGPDDDDGPSSRPPSRTGRAAR